MCANGLLKKDTIQCSNGLTCKKSAQASSYPQQRVVISVWLFALVNFSINKTCYTSVHWSQFVLSKRDRECTVKGIACNN